MAIFEDEQHEHHRPGMRVARLLGLIFAVVLIAVVLSNPITLGAGVALAMLATVAVLCIAPRLLTNPPKLFSRPGQDTSHMKGLLETVENLNTGPLKEHKVLNKNETEESIPPPPALTEDAINDNAANPHAAASEHLKQAAEYIQGQIKELEGLKERSSTEYINGQSPSSEIEDSEGDRLSHSPSSKIEDSKGNRSNK